MMESDQWWISDVKMGEIIAGGTVADIFNSSFACVVGVRLSACTGVLRLLTKKTNSRPTSKTASGGMRNPDKQPLPCAEAAVCRFDVWEVRARDIGVIFLISGLGTRLGERAIYYFLLGS
jgi:hypothetical protein